MKKKKKGERERKKIGTGVTGTRALSKTLHLECKASSKRIKKMPYYGLILIALLLNNQIAI